MITIDERREVGIDLYGHSLSTGQLVQSVLWRWFAEFRTVERVA
jgi:hypothetical protein